MVRGIREREKAARRLSGVDAAIATGLLIVLAIGMEARTPAAVTSAGSIVRTAGAVPAPAPVASNATAEQLVDRVAQHGWDTFTARIAVRRQMVAADGSAVGAAPATTEYSWEKTRLSSGWKTTMTLVGAPQVRVQARTGVATLPQLPTVVKMEDLGDGSAPRFWARDGVEIKMPSAALQARVMGPEAAVLGASMAEEMRQGAHGVQASPQAASTDWIDAFVMPATQRLKRLGAFERQFGQRRGVVRGLSRHVRPQGDGEREVLVDDEVGVPVEANLIVQGETVAHTTFAYERAASGALVKSGVRTERVLSGSNGIRMVTEMSFSDITVEQRGGR